MAESCYYPVSSQEVDRERGCAGRVVRDECAALGAGHLFSDLPVPVRIYRVRPRCHYSNGGKTGFKGGFVRADVCTYCQPADNEGLGACAGEGVHYPFAPFTAVWRDVSCAYYGNGHSAAPQLLVLRAAFCIESYRRVRTFFQKLG